uniref:DUF659 domain-containing protein n=1 Tax=Lactuca sativa TaxID=4236 RepID=A0A9R1XHM8_LACSA|nr:hypothetical protein LSAT_V11C400226400 [Lactuca sativa]
MQSVGNQKVTNLLQVRKLKQLYWMNVYDTLKMNSHRSRTHGIHKGCLLSLIASPMSSKNRSSMCFYDCKFLQGAIDVVGSRNAFQVVTDNVTNCKAAEREIEKVNKHIFCSPCSVHTLNLIFKDLAQKFYWLMDIYKKGKRIVKYFLNHSQVLDMFRENSIFELLKVGKTRFASHFISGLSGDSATTILLNSWRDWVKQGDENTRRVGLGVFETIRNDEFWEVTDNLIAIKNQIF